MVETPHPPDRDAHDPDLEHFHGGHEPNVINLRSLIVFAGGMIAAGIIIHFVLGGMMSIYARRDRTNTAIHPPLFADESGQFPSPRLQDNPTEDMGEFLKDEDRQMARFGWVDKKAGIAQIPVRRALDLLAKKGLPTGEPPHKPSEGAKNPAEPPGSDVNPKATELDKAPEAQKRPAGEKGKP